MWIVKMHKRDNMQALTGVSAGIENLIQIELENSGEIEKIKQLNGKQDIEHFFLFALKLPGKSPESNTKPL